LSVSSVAELTPAPGTTTHHQLQVGQTPIGDLTLPLTVIEGAEPGPVFGIVAGIHACEYAGPVTCIRLAKELDPTELRGRVLIVPVANPRSFEMRTPFLNPLDHQNLNRMFPGKRYGTISEQIALTIHEQIIGNVDTYCDLHSGDMIEAVPPHVGCQVVGDPDLDAKSEALARLFEIDLLNIMGKGIDDLSSTVDEQGTYFAGLQSGITSVGNAALAGVPSVLLEIGGGGTLDPDVVELELRGLCNVLRHLGMLDGEVDNDISHTPCYGMYILKSRFGGLYFPDVVPGEHLVEGQRIGEMRNLEGEVVAEFDSPMTGVVLMMYTSPVRTSGETLLIMGKTNGQG
jgi:uncharacterized protein